MKAEGSQGEAGLTPEIKEGYWWIGDTNTGVKAEGSQGETGATIEKVEFDDQGRLVITLTDGTVLDPVEMPESESMHTHTWGELIDFGDNGALDCDKRIYYCICSTCYELKWVSGTPDDHDFAEDYSNNGFYHWFACQNCEAKDSYEEHALDDGGYCTVCEQHLNPTDGIEYEVSSDGTYAEVINYAGTALRVMIADEYEGVPVKVIGATAFQQKDIISVVIPDTVTKIETKAFYNCEQLTAVTIPNSVKIIGQDAFQLCRNLEEVTFENGLQEIGIGAFAHCYQLSAVRIPDSVTVLGYDAFCDCSLIVKENGVSYADKWAVDFDDSVTTVSLREDTVGIAGQAFSSSQKLRHMTICDSVKYIGASAFSFCQVLADVAIGEGVIDIANRAFYSCGELLRVDVPDRVTYIGDYAFQSCSKLSAVTFGSGLQSIGDSAFNECKALTSVEIPNGVTKIGLYAFAWCGLQTVILGNGVEFIGNSAFASNNDLTAVYYCGTENDWNEMETNEGYIPTSKLYFYSETQPAEEGNYWRYVEDVPTVWNVEV